MSTRSLRSRLGRLAPMKKMNLLFLRSIIQEPLQNHPLREAIGAFAKVVELSRTKGA